MKLFNKTKKEKEIPVSKLQKVYPIFKTTDGVEHEGITYKWANRSGLRCSVGEYLMYDINRDGYIMDKDHVMYPLANVLSIIWNIVEKKNVEEIYSRYHQIFFTDEEVVEMKEVNSFL
ncbi:MAG: hypothetical protein K0R54_1828 [Clostridiaceae bacterium]|jgi:hypothetical protein|nr:hypothetical protein [Clostridiaceae bacterium]